MGDLVLLETEVNPVMLKISKAALRSPPFTITCCAPRPLRSTCTLEATAIPQGWLWLFGMP